MEAQVSGGHQTESQLPGMKGYVYPGIDAVKEFDHLHLQRIILSGNIIVLRAQKSDSYCQARSVGCVKSRGKLAEDLFSGQGPCAGNDVTDGHIFSWITLILQNA